MTDNEKALIAQAISEAASIIREWPMHHPLRPEALRVYKWLCDIRDNLFWESDGGGDGEK